MSSQSDLSLALQISLKYIFKYSLLHDYYYSNYSTTACHCHSCFQIKLIRFGHWCLEMMNRPGHCYVTTTGLGFLPQKVQNIQFRTQHTIPHILLNSRTHCVLSPYVYCHTNGCYVRECDYCFIATAHNKKTIETIKHFTQSCVHRTCTIYIPVLSPPSYIQN